MGKDRKIVYKKGDIINFPSGNYIVVDKSEYNILVKILEDLLNESN